MSQCHGKAGTVLSLCVCLSLLLGATTRPTTTTAPANAQAALRAYRALMEAELAGDVEGIRARTISQGPVETKVVDASIEFLRAMARLRQVSQKAFGEQDLHALVGVSPREIHELVNSATIEMDGPDAIVTLDKQKLRMVYVDGQWKQSIARTVRGWSADKAQRIVDELTHQAELVNALAAEVADQKFHTPRQAAEKLREWLLKPTSRPGTRRDLSIPDD